MTQRHAPATGRNRSYILEVLSDYLPPEGTVLEIASGSGEHAVYFAPVLAPRIWLPSDITIENLASIDAWRAEFPSANLRSAIKLDVAEQPWPVEDGTVTPPVTSIVAINMLHIAPWACCEALFAGAERILPAGGVLYLYGPFKRGGIHTAPSNATFDAQLQARDPASGVRNLEDVIELGEQHHMVLKGIIEMPSNNLSVLFERG